MAETTAMMLLMSSYKKGDKMAKKVKKVKGFQMNRKTGHVSFIINQNKENVRSLGFTHNKMDRSEKIQLKHNINPNDKEKCYVKTRIELQKYKHYRNKKEYGNYRIHDEDQTIVVKIINDNKKRR